MSSYQVTVYCLAFNHAPYIRQTLDGFVKQKTNFPFKVIVHDDASTDGTQEIIREYQQQYPDMIFPILQQENQYSKGVRITKEIIMPLIDTEYMAICEGDDYWNDDNKLQLQYDFLKSHPEYTLCAHNTEMIRGDGQALHRLYVDEVEDREMTADEMIGKGVPCFHTSSCMFRSEVRKKMTDDFTIKGIGDYPLTIFLATQGRVHYIARTMSVYRVNASGSWTQRNMSRPDRAMAHYWNVIEGLERMDALTGKRYSDAFARAIAENRYNLLKLQNKLLTILRDPDMRVRFIKELRTMSPGRIGKRLLKGLGSLFGTLKSRFAKRG